jgi:TP901 family phage tail tape measure protein
MDGQARVSVYLELKNKLKTGLDQAKQYLNKNVQDMKEKLNDLKTSHVQAFKAMKDEVPGFGRAMDLIGNPYVMATAGLVALGATFSAASAKAAEFEDRMAHANVTLQLSKPELKNVSSKVLDIASKSDVKGAATNAPDALNIFASANMETDNAKNLALSMAAIEPTLKAVKWGYADVATTANAATAAMASSGIKDANVVYDVLAATLNKGKAEFKDIAQYLPKVIAQGVLAGVSFQQTAGAFAYFTSMGLSSEKSATALENALKTLADPEKKDAFKKLGVDMFDPVTHKMKPLVDTAKELKYRLRGLTDEQRGTVLGSLGLDNESTIAFGMMIKDVDKLKDSIDSTTNSAGQAKMAYDNSKQSLDSWKVIGNWIEVQFIKMGTVFNEVFGGLGDWIVRNKGWLGDLAIVIGSVATAWGLYALYTSAAAIGTGILSAATFVLATAMSLTGIPEVVIAISALIAGFILAYEHCAKFRAVMAGLMEVGKLVADVFIGVGKTIIGAFTFDAKMIKEGAVQAASAVASIMDGGMNKAFDKGYGTSLAKEAADKAAEEAKKNKPASATANLMGDKKEPIDGNAAKILADEKAKAEKKKGKEAGMSGGSQTKVITINKLSMIDGNFVSNNQEFSGMGKAEMERFLQELFQRMMINLGRSYS